MRDLAKVLAEHVEEAFSTAAFIVPEELPEPPEVGDNWITIVVDFEGDAEGRLVFSAEPSLVAAVASNMLGVEGEDLPLDRQVDAFKEMGNIVCGNLFAGAEFSDAEITILPPLQERSPRLRDDLPGCEEVRLGLEDMMEGKLLVALQLRNRVGEGSPA